MHWTGGISSFTNFLFLKYYAYKWHYKWVTGVITRISGVITLLITGRGPPCRKGEEFFLSFWGKGGDDVLESYSFEQDFSWPTNLKRRSGFNWVNFNTCCFFWVPFFWGQTQIFPNPKLSKLGKNRVARVWEVFCSIFFANPGCSSILLGSLVGFETKEGKKP